MNTGVHVDDGSSPAPTLDLGQQPGVSQALGGPQLRP